MRIADRYIGWQVFFGTILGVTMLTLILVLGQIFKEVRHLLVEQGAPIGILALFIFYVLPSTLLFTLPWGFLVSTLLCFGRLSANNELIGMRMAGLSLRRVALPVLTIAAVFSILCYWINGTVSPTAVSRSKNLVRDLALKDPRVFLQPGVVQSRLGRNKRVYIENKNEDGTLNGFHFYLLSDDTRSADPVAYLHAGHADASHDAAESQIALVLSEAFIESTNEDGTFEIAQASEAKPFFFDISELNKRRIKPRYLTNQEIPTVRTELLAKLDELDASLADPTLSPGLRESHTKEREKTSALASALALEPQKRMALSLACFSFALIGVPLGISARRRETSTGLMLSLLIAALYFSAMLLMNDIEGISRPVMISLFWLPNVICLTLGIWLFRRASFR